MNKPHIFIQRVAQAIWSADPTAGEAWQYVGDQRREGYYAQARAALAAMKVPGGDIHDAGAFSEWQAKPPKFYLNTDHALCVEWNAVNPTGMWDCMIDAALALPDTA
jgi:hypothetical protein